MAEYGGLRFADTKRGKETTPGAWGIRSPDLPKASLQKLHVNRPVLDDFYLVENHVKGRL